MKEIMLKSDNIEMKCYDINSLRVESKIISKKKIKLIYIRKMKKINKKLYKNCNLK